MKLRDRSIGQIWPQENEEAGEEQRQDVPDFGGLISLIMITGVLEEWIVFQMAFDRFLTPPTEAQIRRGVQYLSEKLPEFEIHFDVALRQ